MAYLPPLPRLLTPFMYRQMSASHTYQGQDYPERIAELNRRMLAALHRAGAGILLCTDAAQSYHIPGFAIHEELALLVEAGLSPYEALAAGTRDAAIALGRANELGTVAEGLRADLLLLDENPLKDVTSASRPAGVMLRGRWMSEEDLHEMLAGLEISFRPTRLERVWPAVLIAVALYVLQRQRKRISS